MRGWCFLVLFGGCAGIEGAPDAGPVECQMQAWYADGDGDGHGNPARVMQACTQPADHVAAGDDCDDANALRFPGLPDSCDGIDNDCEISTPDMCPAGCAPIVRSSTNRVYLMCNNATSWSVARSVCASAQFTLAQIDNASENTFVRNTASSALGTVPALIGGNDLTVEGRWVWDGGVQFWSGQAAGTPVGGRYANWVVNEPNSTNNNEDCVEMTASGQWNDVPCDGYVQRYICRR